MPGFSCQQGDIFIREVARASEGDPVPRDSQGRLILAHGERTGHSHAIASPNVDLFQGADDHDDQTLIVSEGGADLVHEEHGTIAIPPGTYQVCRQRRYDLLSESGVQEGD